MSLCSYKDVAKSSNDLFSADKYGFKSLFTHHLKVNDDITLQTSGSAKDFNVEAVYKTKARKAKAKVTSKAVVKVSDTEKNIGGYPVEATVEISHDAKKSSTAKLDADYTMGGLMKAGLCLNGTRSNGPVKGDEKSSVTTLEGYALLYNGDYNISGALTAKADLGTMDLSDYGFNFRYNGFKGADFVLESQKSLSDIKTSVFHQRTDELAIASYGLWSTSDMTPKTVGFAFEQKLSSATTLKGKAEFAEAPTISLFAEHTLAKPGVKIGFSTTTDKLSFSFPSDMLSLGMGFTVGDF